MRMVSDVKGRLVVGDETLVVDARVSGALGSSVVPGVEDVEIPRLVFEDCCAAV